LPTPAIFVSIFLRKQFRLVVLKKDYTKRNFRSKKRAKKVGRSAFKIYGLSVKMAKNLGWAFRNWYKLLIKILF